MPIPDVLRRLPAGFALPKAPPSVKWTAPDEGRQEEEIEFSWARETARHVGTVVHRWLQRVASDGVNSWTPHRVASLRDMISRELLALGVAAVDLSAASNRVGAALSRTIADQRGQWILG